jgi:hypothetical protein
MAPLDRSHPFDVRRRDDGRSHAAWSGLPCVDARYARRNGQRRIQPLVLVRRSQHGFILVIRGRSGGGFIESRLG